MLHTNYTVILILFCTLLYGCNATHNGTQHCSISIKQLSAEPIIYHTFQNALFAQCTPNKSLFLDAKILVEQPNQSLADNYKIQKIVALTLQYRIYNEDTTLEESFIHLQDVYKDKESPYAAVIAKEAIMQNLTTMLAAQLKLRIALLQYNNLENKRTS